MFNLNVISQNVLPCFDWESYATKSTYGDLMEKIRGIAEKQNEALKVTLASDNFKVHTLLRAVL